MPEPTAAPVVVTPIPASESRTLRTAWLVQIGTVIVGFLPDIIEILMTLLMTDPAFAEAVGSWFPRPVRYTAMAVLLAYAQRSKHLRNTTAAPIAGTLTAEAAQPLRGTPQSYRAPHQTGDQS